MTTQNGESPKHCHVYVDDVECRASIPDLMNTITSHCVQKNTKTTSISTSAMNFGVITVNEFH